MIVLGFGSIKFFHESSECPLEFTNVPLCSCTVVGMRIVVSGKCTLIYIRRPLHVTIFLPLQLESPRKYSKYLSLIEVAVVEYHNIMEGARKIQVQLNEETIARQHNYVVHTMHLLPTIKPLCIVRIIPGLPNFDEYLVNNTNTILKTKIQTRRIMQLNLVGLKYLMSKCISDTQSSENHIVVQRQTRDIVLKRLIDNQIFMLQIYDKVEQSLLMSRRHDPPNQNPFNIGATVGS